MNLTPAGAHVLDTSAIILLIRHDLIASPEAVIPFAALGELSGGAIRARHQELEFARVRATIHPAAIAEPTWETAFYYGWIVDQLRRIGQMIPVNDIWNAAHAMEHDIPLLADDAHFRRVPGRRFIPVR